LANKRRVMIVDDDDDIRITIKQILEKNGYKVYDFDNGYDCLKMLENGKKPTLIVLDIMMPLMSGWEIQRRLQAHPRWRKIPIIFLTGRTTNIAEEMYERYGIEYIKKPFSLSEFKESIKRAILTKHEYLKQREKRVYC